MKVFMLFSLCPQTILIIFALLRTQDEDDEQRSLSEEMKDKLIYIAQVSFM